MLFVRMRFLFFPFFVLSIFFPPLESFSTSKHDLGHAGLLLGPGRRLDDGRQRLGGRLPAQGEPSLSDEA